MTMTYLPARLPKLLGLAAAAALGFTLVAASSQAEAGYYKRYYRSYQPYNYGSYPTGNNYGYRSYGNGNYEIRELQRLFPETNWPPSLRYHQY
jgi:hypothetical protein